MLTPLNLVFINEINNFIIFGTEGWIFNDRIIFDHTR